MSKIEVTNEQVDSRSGDGWSSRSQQAWFHKEGNPYPIEIKIKLQKDQPPHKCGMYLIDFKNSLYTDRYKNLALSNTLVLVPAK